MAIKRKLFIFRFNKITGYWVFERSVTEQTVGWWMGIYSRDSPGEYFHVSSRRPKHNPVT